MKNLQLDATDLRKIFEHSITVKDISSKFSYYPGSENSKKLKIIMEKSDFDITGRLVETLVNGKIESGNQEIQWDASHHSNGIYFVRLKSNKFVETQKIVLVK
tara:strand:- start:299 stop:607 length:309 start_codon:yes stop_codon:yes gene_type:complete